MRETHGRRTAALRLTVGELQFFEALEGHAAIGPKPGGQLPISPFRTN